MLENYEEGKFINLKNIPKTFEIPIERLFDYNDNNNNNNKKNSNKLFSYEEYDFKDSSAGIKYEQYENILLININGPKECKFRDKAKNETCIIEIYTKNCKETKKESK
jgi:hypothetical protein